MVKVVRQIIAEQSRKVVKAFTGKHKFLLYCGENVCLLYTNQTIEELECVGGIVVQYRFSQLYLVKLFCHLTDIAIVNFFTLYNISAGEGFKSIGENNFCDKLVLQISNEHARTKEKIKSGRRPLDQGHWYIVSRFPVLTRHVVYLYICLYICRTCVRGD